MQNRPNILFMIADDHRHDAIHALGDETVQTPNLDAMIERGTCFRNAHIMGGLSGAVCVPTRACMHTASPTFRASVSNRVDDYRSLLTINPEKAVMGEAFRQAGYHTFGTGKWHNDRASFARSFTSGANIFFGGMSDHLQVPIHDFDPSGQYPDEAKYMGDGFSTDLFCDAAINFLETYNQDAPFFLYLSFTSPHDPRMAPEPYGSMYRPADMPVPANFMAEHPFDNGDMRLRDEVLATFPRTPEIVQEHIADYYGMITHHDYHIGRIFETLKAHGYADNTIIVYTADHGLAVGQHGLLGKQNMYDHSLRVPSIIQGPNIPQGKQIDQLTFSFDMFPTLCDLAGIDIPESVESPSLQPLISGKTEQGRDSVFSVYKDIQRMVKKGDWKLTRHYESATNGEGTNRLQLFNVADDPWEMNDLSTVIDLQPRIQELAALLATWQGEVDDPMRGTSVIP
ncbi:MAG: sulfatase-like hydrolase/transferase [Chloroflexota bacterium]